MAHGSTRWAPPRVNWHLTVTDGKESVLLVPVFAGNGRKRHVSLITVRPGEGRLTKPATGAQPERRELVFMPHCRRSPHDTGRTAVDRWPASPRRSLDRTDKSRSALTAGTALHAPIRPLPEARTNGSVGWKADLARETGLRPLREEHWFTAATPSRIASSKTRLASGFLRTCRIAIAAARRSTVGSVVAR